LQVIIYNKVKICKNLILFLSLLHIIHDEAIKFAKRHFSDGNKGYCLGTGNPKHLPHITLAQIAIEDSFDVSKLYNALASGLWSTNNSVTLATYYHDQNRHYAGLNVDLSDELKQLHNHITHVHHDLGIEIINPHGDDYWPHMTFSKNPNSLPESVPMPITLQGLSKGWKLEFGYMGDHGVYLGKYNPNPAMSREFQPRGAH
jgi:2'-5' RNA ligase